MHVQGHPNSTWCCNPQFRVTTRQNGELLLCVGQQDPMLRNGRHIPKLQRVEKVGFMVFSAAGNHHGRIWTPAGQHLLHDTGLQGARELSLSIKLQTDRALIVVPYCHLPGFEGPFILRSFSSVPIEMTQVYRTLHKSIRWIMYDYINKTQRVFCAGSLTTGPCHRRGLERAPCGRGAKSSHVGIQSTIYD